MVKVRDCKWTRAPSWVKRLSGCASYLLCACFALLAPVHTDKALYEVLREQFEDDGQ